VKKRPSDACSPGGPSGRRRPELDATAADQAIDDLAGWPGERFGHRTLIGRAWDLRSNVRGWDAVYVALAEVLDATLVTVDARLAAATGPRCTIEVVGG
jgi:predicted nucleic acid-binding protein